MEAVSFAQRFSEFVADEKRALELAQQELAELRLLVRQTSNEIERVTQLNNQAVARLREVEASLDTYSRNDLRTIFRAASESQLRLFMMQAQLEQLQSQQRGLERLIEQLQRSVDLSGEFPDVAGAQQPAPVAAVPVAPSQQGTARLTPVDNRRQVIAKIIEAQEDERSKVARQIHDGPAQALTNVILRAEICERLLDVDRTRAHAELAELKTLISDSLQQTRRFIFDLRPMILDDLGLIPTLRKYTQSFEERSDLAVELTVMGRERRLPAFFEVAVFRVIQEAVENASAHARATQGRITVDVQADRLEFGVEDNGSGFDAERVVADARERKTGAVGIADMIERVEALGGTIRFESVAGRGTRLSVRLPIPDDSTAG